MKVIVIVVLLVTALSEVSAYPLQGSNGDATVVLFESSRMPLIDANSGQEMLRVDVGLMGVDNATYELVDQNDQVYTPGLYWPQSSGKQSIYFLIEKDILFKLIKVTPEGSDPISLNWWNTPKAANDRMIVRYYGITNRSFNFTDQSIVLQVTVQNIGAESIYVTPLNFTLLDQWGWSYKPTEAYFDAETIEPGSATGRLLLGFYNLSPFVRPAALAYDYFASGQMVIEFEKDYVPLSDESVHGTRS
jgi:hypothetical protein